MTARTLEDFERYEREYNQPDCDMNLLVSEENGLFYLTLRSLARSEYLQYVAQNESIDTQNITTIKGLLPLLYTSTLTLDTLRQAIRALYTVERAERQTEEPALLAELLKLRVFDWGGIHQNDINRYLVDRYVKPIKNYDTLVNKIETEAIQSLKGFVLCSWYNNWTSILIEDIFKDHSRVAPTVGKIKQVDFFIGDTPFDLKVTYFPAGFLKEERRRRGISPIDELAELKKLCKQFDIPVDSTRPDPDLKVDITTALSEHPETEVQEAYNAFVSTRRSIIDESVSNPRPLLTWLYENQGMQRFDTSNRLFLVLIDRANLEESWKLKRNYSLLTREINTYLNTRSFSPQNLLLTWSVGTRSFESYADVLFILR
ncbi:MAG: hypothetical protein NT023_18405 [Armatimonadetes bacterium]|nr:hypothetical protein [Armatimonadota bacterium]